MEIVEVYFPLVSSKKKPSYNFDMRLIAFSFTFLSFFLSLELKAQDERYFRELFLKQYTEDTKELEEKKYSYVVPTPFYTMDVNGDGKTESFVYAKKEAEDWIDIFDHEKKPVFKFQFTSVGAKSRLYKMRFSHIDSEIGLVVFYFYEGVTKYNEMDSSSRLYFLTFHKKDFNQFKMIQGPYLFEEFKGMKGHYHQRVRQVEVMDLNSDQRNEIIVKHHLYSEVYHINKDGSFKVFRKKI